MKDEQNIKRGNVKKRGSNIKEGLAIALGLPRPRFLKYF